MKVLCAKHGKEYREEQSPRAVIIRRDEENCERCKRERGREEIEVVREQ